ncbi:MAG: hypothetical protein ONB44_14355 [candidate division KSB1 bacterium]|nr:hypothetical protein [candidate division KSB1 bacterium]MDZ7303308.1 hypothetical protein [candidate division KSB1 bacterium]MDZ7312610.1 hypothetical protein [candidate division KSB1 bacterium]
MRQNLFDARHSVRLILSVIVIVICSLFLARPALAQQAEAGEQLDVNPFLNLLALALVIERLLEIGVTFFPGLEEKKKRLDKDSDQLAALKLAISRTTMLVGMVLGVLACTIFHFGILDEIFPGRHLSMNLFNHILTGIIAGTGADPVHQLVLILVSVKERLRSE